MSHSTRPELNPSDNMLMKKLVFSPASRLDTQRLPITHVPSVRAASGFPFAVNTEERSDLQEAGPPVPPQDAAWLLQLQRHRIRGTQVQYADGTGA